MARIVYKEGFEGQNNLESIEGIEIELLNGQKALIYPKYAERKLLGIDDIDKWKAPRKSEIGALKVRDTINETQKLYIIGSPAAEWVNQFQYGRTRFCLPSLLAAMEIQYQKEEIDTLAVKIDGADILQHYTSDTWSCSRYGGCGGWRAGGNYGFGGGDNSYSEYLAVPTILL